MWRRERGERPRENMNLHCPFPPWSPDGSGFLWSIRGARAWARAAPPANGCIKARASRSQLLGGEMRGDVASALKSGFKFTSRIDSRSLWGKNSVSDKSLTSPPFWLRADLRAWVRIGLGCRVSGGCPDLPDRSGHCGIHCMFRISRYSCPLTWNNSLCWTFDKNLLHKLRLFHGAVLKFNHHQNYCVF